MRHASVLVLALVLSCASQADRTAAWDRSPFTLVVLPDTQYYCDASVGGSPEMYLAQTRWIRERAAADNVRFVIHLGDIVNEDLEEQWRIADRSHRVIDGVVPYSMLPGNHDMQGTDTTLYNRFFGPGRFEDRGWYGGGRGGRNDNNFAFFEGGGERYMVVSLRYDPTDEMLRWASDVIRRQADRRTIVVSHEYMTREGRSPIGTRIWEGVVRRNENVFMVLSGHIIGWSHQTRLNDAGRPVHEILTNYQWEPDGLTQPPLGGDGWLNTLRFLPAENRIYFRSYSPWLKRSRETPAHQYVLEYDMTR